MYTFICFIFLYAQHIYIYLLYPGPVLGYFEAVSSFQPRSFPNKTQVVRLSLPGVTYLVPPSWWWFLRQFLLDPWTDLNMQGVSGPDKRHEEVPSGHIYFNLHHWTCLWETFNNTYLHHYIKCFCSVSVAEIKAKRECFHLQTVVMYVVYGGIRFNLPTKVAVKWWREVALAKRLVSCWMHF